jgi:hypothetical protein
MFLERKECLEDTHKNTDDGEHCSDDFVVFVEELARWPS